MSIIANRDPTKALSQRRAIYKAAKEHSRSKERSKLSDSRILGQSQSARELGGFQFGNQKDVNSNFSLLDSKKLNTSLFKNTKQLNSTVDEGRTQNTKNDASKPAYHRKRINTTTGEKSMF